MLDSRHLREPNISRIPQIFMYNRSVVSVNITQLLRNSQMAMTKEDPCEEVTDSSLSLARQKSGGHLGTWYAISILDHS